MSQKNIKNKATVRVLLDSLSDPAVIVDEKGNLITVNEAFQEATGLNSKEVVGTPLIKLNIVSRESKAILLENLKNRLHGLSVESYEICFDAKGGETRWVEVTGKTISYAGKPASLAIFHDVTDRKKKAEEQIRFSEEKYKSLFENAPDVIVTIDLTGKITSANKAVLQHGFKENEIVGKSIFELVPKDRHQKMLIGLKDIAAGNSTKGELEILTPNGKITAEYNSTPILQSGQVAGYQTMLRDVTERKEAENTLRKSEAEYSSLFSNMMDGFAYCQMIFDEKNMPVDFVYLQVNDAFEKITGLKREVIVGKKVTEAIPGIKEANPEIFEIYGRVALTCQKEKFEVFFKPLSLWLSISVYCPRKGYFAAVFEDITERKNTEEALGKSEEKHRKIFEESLDAIFVADAVTGIIVDCNGAAANLVGRKKSELVGQHQSIIHPKEQMAEGDFTKGFKQHLKDQARILETEILTKTGEIRDVAVKGTIFELNDKRLMQGTFRDITEQKRLGLEIERLAKFPSENPNPVFRVNGNGKLLYCNASAACFLEIWNISVGKLVPEHIRKTVADALLSNKRNEIEEKCGSKTFSLLFTPVTVEGYVNVYGNDITERKLMHNSLEESEEKFRSITNAVRDAIIMVDNEAKVVSWNPAAEKLFGYSKIEAIGKKIHELVVPQTMSLEGREYIRMGVQQFAKTGSGAFINGNVELIGQRKDGTEFSVEVSLSPVRLHEKWRMVGVVKDITERKHAEQKLREAEKRYRTLFNQAPLGVLLIDPQIGKAVEFNDVSHNQLGYSREEFSKLYISDFEAQKTKEEIDAEITKILTIGEDEFETKHRTKNGEIRDVLINIRAVELDGKPFFDCIFHDITEIRRVQNALMESETKYRQLVNVAQEGIWAFDNNYHIVFANPRMTQMLGYHESELAGKNIYEFLDETNLEKVKELSADNDRSREGQFECKLKRKNNSWIYAGIVASPLKDDNGNAVGTLAMVSDITERKTLERKVSNYSKHLKSMVELRTTQLKYANEQLVKSERLAAIGELAGMVGHDLRNPLSAIKNAAYYLKKKGTAISELQSKEMLETIDKSIEHSDKIINDLLEYAREVHFELTKYEAHSVIDEAIRMIQIPERIQIVNHVQEETWICVNADKIMRVFINLIKNAIDAMPNKGTLEISSRQTADNIEISFADTGTGISEETLQKLFTPLFTTKAQGMGFGLAICKRIIEAHSGSIKVETEVNKGTTFTVTLPVKTNVKVGGEKIWVNVPESLLLTTTKT